jgi:hypothetical protein
MPMSFDPTRSADGIWLGISVIAFVAVFQYVFVPTLLDGFRDRLFELRRELFTIMMSGRIAPTDVAYVSLRRLLNGCIRFAGRLTFVRGFIGPALALSIMNRKSLRRAEAEHVRALGAIEDAELRNELKKLYDRTGTAIFAHVVLSSPTAWFLAIVVAAPLLFVKVSI